MSPGNGDQAIDGIEEWVTQRVADYVEMPAAQLQRTVPLAEYGMDSASGIGLCGDIEREFHISVDPTLIYDFPTISDIAVFVTAEAAAVAHPAAVES